MKSKLKWIIVRVIKCLLCILTGKKKGVRMREIDTIVVHCTATRADVPLSPHALDAMHRRRGFDGCGYHYYIRRDGQICSMRPVERTGAHARGFNAKSIGIAYEGGLDAGGRLCRHAHPAATPCAVCAGKGAGKGLRD